MIIFAALWGPSAPEPELFENGDKLNHLLGFAGLGLAWTVALERLRWPVLLVIAIAGISEVGQGYLPWPRTPDWADFAFDLAGGGLGILLAVGLWRLGLLKPVAASSPSTK